jgi:hypothetical protein
MGAIETGKPSFSCWVFKYRLRTANFPEYEIWSAFNAIAPFGKVRAVSLRLLSSTRPVNCGSKAELNDCTQFSP